MRIRCVFLTALMFGVCWVALGQYISPTDSATRIHRVAPTTRPWYEPDGSLESLNAGCNLGRSAGMIRIMKEGLVGEQCPLATTLPGTKEYITRISDALHRSGDSPEITNILHQALLAPTNHYREATFRAYVMAFPVPMTVLAETVVKNFSLEERKAWYARSGSKTLNPYDPITRFIDRPSRESLRYSHFLNRVKALETDPDCLRIISDLVDPKWE